MKSLGIRICWKLLECMEVITIFHVTVHVSMHMHAGALSLPYFRQVFQRVFGSEMGLWQHLESQFPHGFSTILIEMA